MGFDKNNTAESEKDSNLIIGRNAVSEALRDRKSVV